ncbi:LysM peptidoglycan-binding domain-containing protein [Calderihabitans maritimus]|uniref:LysM domain-containing protein n=1 Tax=Calderihabitans maritimus TaxID=1246530 RepID=A0A1Z5HPL9_9FIRM|nr:LysM peptidoglycan-binding domain-containing protein [Calderihabitans maritimus]GAW91476.1 hypothetical protein KKC1_06380 [Calderihabitans maritimus]
MKLISFGNNVCRSNTKKHFQFVAMVLLVTAIFFFLTAQVQRTVAADSGKAIFKEVVVRKGDTLWNVAKRHLQPGEDIRAFIYEIKQINSLETSMVYPGQVLRIPVIK